MFISIANTINIQELVDDSITPYLYKLNPLIKFFLKKIGGNQITYQNHTIWGLPTPDPNDPLMECEVGLS